MNANRNIETRSEREIWLARVQAYGMSLEHVPSSLKDPEMCLAAVKKDGLALYYVPEKERTPAVYLAAVQQNGDALNIIPEEEKTKELCLEAVKTTGTAVQYVPAKFLDDDICMAAVEKDGLALPYLPNPPTNLQCQAAVKQNGLALEYVPIDAITPELCSTAVHQNGMSLKFVPAELITPEICLAAVSKNGKALQFVPKGLLTADVYLAAVTQNGLVLDDVPESARTPDMCAAAIKQNALALEFVPDKLLTPENCIAAVTQNSMALEFVPEDLKTLVFDKIGLKNIVANNYAARKFVPNTPENDQAITDFLINVDNVIVAYKDNVDYEIKDFISVYGNHKKRIGKTVHVYSEDHTMLLDDLANLKAKSINLVLIDHANESSVSVGGFLANELTEVLTKYEYINKVTLLACNTVKTKVLDREKAMIQQYADSENSNSTGNGFFIMSRELQEKDYADILTKAKLDSVAVLIKKDNSYKLVFLKLDSQTKMAVASPAIPLTEQQISGLQKIANKNKKFPFPKEEQRINTVRDASLPINEKDWENILAITTNVKRFDRAHPNYQNDKKIIPFLSSVTVDESECKGQLLNSFLTKVVDKVVEERNDGNLHRDVQIKGYPNPIHVDTKDQRMHVTRTHLYTNDYKSPQFFNKTDNIDRKKLDDERSKNQLKMKDKKYQSEKKQDESLLKSIVVQVKKG